MQYKARKYVLSGLFDRIVMQVPKERPDVVLSVVLTVVWYLVTVYT